MGTSVATQQAHIGACRSPIFSDYSTYTVTVHVRVFGAPSGAYQLVVDPGKVLWAQKNPIQQ